MTARRVLLALLAGLFLPPAVAGAAPGQAESGTLAEAWYHTASPCSAGIVSCPDTVPPTSPYPEETLHIGIAAGTETARTYVALDLGGLPEGAELTGGTLRLPVAPEDAGTVTPEAAKLVVCAVDVDIQEVSGSLDEPPGVNCGTQSEAVFEPGDDAAFTVDLQPFAEAWTAVPMAALAILPADAARTESATWHVAVDGKDRTGPGVQPITALLDYDEPEPEPEVEEEPEEEEFEETAAPSDDSGFEDFDTGDFLPTVGLFPQLGPTTSTIEPSGREELAVEPSRTRLAGATGGYRYPIVWLLPLVLIALGGCVARLLTAPVEGRGGPSGRYL